MFLRKGTMSEQFDYIKQSIDKAREIILNRMIGGSYTAIENLRYDAGYLKALQDVEQFGRDYVTAKNPPRPDEDEI